MLPFNQKQLRLLVLALDTLRSEIAADLNGWTIGEHNQPNDIENLCTSTQMDVEIALMREALQQEIH